MTPSFIIKIGLLCQLFLYILLDVLHLKVWKYLIFSILLFLYIFILPSYFITIDPNNKFICSEPILAIKLVFWFLGCGSTIILHLLNVFIRDLYNSAPQ